MLAESYIYIDLMRGAGAGYRRLDGGDAAPFAEERRHRVLIVAPVCVT